MITEQSLIKEIFGNNIKDEEVLLQCDLKTQELKYNQRSPRIKMMVLNIIKLLWKRNIFDIGNRLIESKSIIIESLISIYQHPLQAHTLEKNFEKIEKYGIIMTLLINSKLLFNEYFYNFFEMFLRSGTICQILNTIFEKFELYSSFKFNINIDELIEIIKLSGCIENGKCNFSKLNDFIYKKLNIKEEKKIEEKNEHKNKVNQSHKNKKQKKHKQNIKHIDNNNEKEINSINNINININNNISGQPQSANDTRFIQYFKERKILYNNKGLKTEVLDDIINKNIKINLDLFAYKKCKEDWMIDQYYLILERIINIFDDVHNFEIINKKLIGYFCFKNTNNQIIEGIYSIIPLDILFIEITDKMKYKPCPSAKPDDILINSKKAHFLNLEYYINDILINDLKLEELPRVFFYFNSPNIKEGKEGNYKIEELSGVYYSDKKIALDNVRFPFIKENILERNIQKGIFEYKNETKNNIILEENSLNLIDIKNSSEINYNENKNDLEKEVLAFLNKALLFYELNKEKYQSIKKIKLLLFYETLNNINNNNDIFIKIFENFFKNTEYTDLVEKIQFQLIFIKSEYLTIRIKDLNDKIKYLEQLIISYNINFKDIKDENERLKNENNNLKYSIANQKIEYEEKKSKLKNEYEEKIKKLESLLNTQ